MLIGEGDKVARMSDNILLITKKFFYQIKKICIDASSGMSDDTAIGFPRL
jgi:hypothetical protein